MSPNDVRDGSSGAGRVSGLAQAVRERREELGLRQVEVADLPGCSQRFLHTVEHGKDSLRLDKVLDVLEVLGLELRVGPGRGRIVGGTDTLDRVAIPGVQDKVSARMINVPVARESARFILKLDPPELPHLIRRLTQGEWRITPAYDVPSSYPYADTTMALSIHGRRREDIGRADFVALGAAVGVSARAVERALDELFGHPRHRLGLALASRPPVGAAANVYSQVLTSPPAALRAQVASWAVAAPRRSIG